MGRAWNNSEQLRATKKAQKNQTEKEKKRDVKSRLNVDLERFFGKGGVVQELPSCKCAINAATNKPFQQLET